VLDITIELLERHGLDGLLLDLDSTLVDYRGTEFSAAVVEWVRDMARAGVRLCIVSNGRADRIEPMARKLDVAVIANAAKPLPFGMRRALSQLGIERRRAAVVGDQLFTDVLAGRWAGLYTILVTPTSPLDPWFTRIKRPLERWLLRRLRATALPDSAGSGRMLDQRGISG
jgi:hypothetical protein